MKHNKSIATAARIDTIRRAAKELREMATEAYEMGAGWRGVHLSEIENHAYEICVHADLIISGEE